jgi:hypothetical protein
MPVWCARDTIPHPLCGRKKVLKFMEKQFARRIAAKIFIFLHEKKKNRHEYEWKRFQLNLSENS